MINQNSPIGVFDSGVGGLTVVKSIIERLAHESIVYFGDTARVPYGTKSKDSITSFSREIVEFLIERKVKLIVIACNTVCASSLEILSRDYSIPIIGVIGPGSRAAVNSTKNLRVGVIGTPRTIDSGAYLDTIKFINNNIEITSLSCPLFVPLVEEGWNDNTIALSVAEKYLSPLKQENIDTLVLGCTHYPLLKGVISKVLGPTVDLVDSGDETANEVDMMLTKLNMKSDHQNPTYNFYVSDAEEKFLVLAKQILQTSISNLTKIQLNDKVYI